MAGRKEQRKKGSRAGSKEPAHAGPCRLGSLKSGLWDFPDSSIGKESACNAGDTGSIPGSGRSPGEGIGYPLQYSWASLVAQLVKNRMQCRRPGFNHWVGKIPWRRERLPTPVFWPGEFQSMGLQRVGLN